LETTGALVSLVAVWQHFQFEVSTYSLQLQSPNGLDCFQQNPFSLNDDQIVT